MKEMWNDKYAKEEYHYGKKPNEFYSKQIEILEPGKILFLGEGEGRNAVHAAKLGWDVDAYDFSTEAKTKALKFAGEEGVTLNYFVQDLNIFSPKENYYDAVIIVFLHMPQDQRIVLHKNIINTLKPAGRVILEVFDKKQIKKQSGGPKNLELLYSLEDIFEDFQDLDIITFSNEEIELDEGLYHNGLASVIRYVGEKNNIS
jgi:SAM-dependent methyltransferase